MKKILISLPCWGKVCQDKMIKYTIPFLLSRKNLLAVYEKGYQIEIILYTFESQEKEIKLNPMFEYLVKIAVVKFYFLDERNTDKNYFIFCHEDTLTKAGKEGCIVFLYGAEGILLDGSLLFALEKIESGYQLVLHSAFRVNEDQALLVLNKLMNDKNHRHELTYQAAQNMILNHLHIDEIKYNVDGPFKPDQWPGVPSWMQNGEALVKLNAYYNPILFRVEEGMTLSGGTLDGTILYNQFLPEWNDKVYVNNDIKKSCIIDLTENKKEKLPFVNGKNIPVDFAKNFFNKKIYAWQLKAMEKKVVVPVGYTGQLVDNASLYMNLIKKEIIKKAEDILNYLEMGCVKKFGLHQEKKLKIIFEKISYLEEEFKNQVVVLCGCGELFAFVVSRLNLKKVSFEIYDQDLYKLFILGHVYPMINSCYESSVEKVFIPMSVGSERQIANDIRKSIHHEVQIMFMDWSHLNG